MRAVEDALSRRSACLDRRRIHVWLERRACLALRLGGAVELGEVEVPAADQSENVACGIVHGQQRAFDAGILLEVATQQAAVLPGQVDVDDVTSRRNSSAVLKPVQAQSSGVSITCCCPMRAVTW